MIFPYDVQKKSMESAGMTKSQTTKLIMTMTVIVSLIFLMIVAPWLSGMGIPLWVPILVEVIVIGILGVTFIRIFVIREDDMIKEKEEGTYESFAKYHMLRNMDSGETIKFEHKEYPVYQFDNGSMTTTFRFTFGDNNDRLTVLANMALTRILNLVGTNGLEIQVTTCKEPFLDSIEVRDQMGVLNKIPDKKLKKSTLDITHAVLDVTEEQSNVDVMYIRIRTKFSYQKYILGSVVNEIIGIIKERRTCYRSVEVLEVKPLLDFYKDFYCIEAIDLSMMKVRDIVNTEEVSSKVVEIYQIIDEDGRTMTRTEVVDSAIRTAQKLRL